MSLQKTNEPVALPQFSHDLGGFVSRLRSRLFSTQSKAANYFGLKSHGTISRYESETLRPPLGYLANLVRLYVDKLEQEGQPPGAGQSHFLREVNRVVRQHYSWDEAPFTTGRNYAPWPMSLWLLDGPAAARAKIRQPGAGLRKTLRWPRRATEACKLF